MNTSELFPSLVPNMKEKSEVEVTALLKSIICSGELQGLIPDCASVVTDGLAIFIGMLSFFFSFILFEEGSSFDGCVWKAIKLKLAFSSLFTSYTVSDFICRPSEHSVSVSCEFPSSHSIGDDVSGLVGLGFETARLFISRSS